MSYSAQTDWISENIEASIVFGDFPSKTEAMQTANDVTEMQAVDDRVFLYFSSRRPLEIEWHDVVIYELKPNPYDIDFDQLSIYDLERFLRGGRIFKLMPRHLEAVP